MGDDTQRDELHHEIEPLLFAESDMRQVMAAVDALLGETLNGDLCRALETATIVCYARAFTNTKVGKLGGRWIPVDPAQRKLHKELIRLRHTVYAHTDRIGAREITDAGTMLGLGKVAFVEGWHPIDRVVLPTIRALAEYQDGRLKKRIFEIGNELTSLG